MKTLIDFDAAPVFALPMMDTVGRRRLREGMLVEGPQGWGEFSPGPDTDPGALGRWLTAAVEAGTVGWPDPVRGRIPVAVTVPAVDPAHARRIVSDSACTTAEVSVGVSAGSHALDIARLEAVRDCLGPNGALRCNALGQWDIDGAVTAITALDKAAGGLEYVLQPCATPHELAAVRRRVGVPIAVDGSRPGMPLALKEFADVAVLSCGPMGGVRRALRIAEACGLPSVVTSGLESSVGLAGGLALAGALPELPFACALGTRLLLAGDVVALSRQLIPAGGWLPVAPMPPAPDRDLLARYAITDANRVAWWRDRLRAAGTDIP